MPVNYNFFFNSVIKYIICLTDIMRIEFFFLKYLDLFPLTTPSHSSRNFDYTHYYLIYYISTQSSEQIRKLKKSVLRIY